MGDSAAADNVPMPDAAPPPPITGLLLTGGGARAAYQVGVLEAIADIRKAAGALHQDNPFPIITGTSAGAVNAAALACGADDFDSTVRRIARVWKNIHAQQIYRADSFRTARSARSHHTHAPDGLVGDSLCLSGHATQARRADPVFW